MIPARTDMESLVGRRFPGGHYEIAHWENFLLSEATGAAPLDGGLAHPVHLFHVAIAGVGTTIGELFALAESDRDAPVSIDYYDWQLFEPLREGVRYSLQGGVCDYARRESDGGPTVDSFTYEIDIEAPEGPRVARVEFRWHYWRF